MISKRIKLFLVSPELILQWFMPGPHGAYEVVETELTEHSKVVGAGYDPWKRSFWIQVENPGFPEVLSGEKLTEVIPPLMKKVRDA